MKVSQIFNSKTINFNALMVAIMVVVAAMGYEIPSEVSNAILILGNVILRFITKEPLSAK